jgi:pimeloyl-ACP methyl ester carboxylesterase
MTTDPAPSVPAPRSRGRRRRRLGVILLALLAVLIFGPFLVPLPTTPDRPASDVARELGIAGSLVDVDGTRAWVIDAGPADGSPVVLVHGFGGSTWSWRATIPALVGAGHRVLALDLANFGLSDKAWERDSSHARQAELVATVMAQHGIARAAVVGHSMGANVLGWLAARQPELVERAVLVDGATGPSAQGGGGPLGILLNLPNVRRTGQLALRALVDDERLAGILASAYTDPSRATPDALRGYGAALETAGWDDALLAVVRDGGANALSRPIGEILQVPTLVIWGRHDEWIPLAAGEALRDAIPGADWSIIDDAGHLPMEEQPAAFNTTLLAWLESTP